MSRADLKLFYVDGCCHIIIEWDRRKGGRLSVSGLLVQYLYIHLHTPDNFF